MSHSTDSQAVPSYYGNVNHTLLAEVDVSAARILELGCGAGALARAVRERAPQVHYVGLAASVSKHQLLVDSDMSRVVL